MQKKFIALAVAGLVSGSAFAQSNVTIYGVADMAYQYRSDSINSNVKSLSGLNDGAHNQSRFGFKGTEDLGNGLSANFQIEVGTRLDRPAEAGALVGRNSWVSLKSASLGEVKAGSMGSFTDDILGSTSTMNGKSTSSGTDPVFQYAITGDVGNAVSYYSPSWSGFQVKLGMSTQFKREVEVEPAASVTQPAAANNRMYQISAYYKNGPLVAGIAYETFKKQDVSTQAVGFDSGTDWTIGASYDFGVVRINGAYGVINPAQDGATVTVDKRTQWLVGASVPVIAGTSFAAINYAHGKNSFNNTWADETNSLWGIGYFHNLSKRTLIYTSYGAISQDDTNNVKTNIGGSSQAGLGSTTYQKSFQLGVKHSF